MKAMLILLAVLAGCNATTYHQEQPPPSTIPAEVEEPSPSRLQPAETKEDRQNDRELHRVIKRANETLQEFKSQG